MYSPPPVWHSDDLSGKRSTRPPRSNHDLEKCTVDVTSKEEQQQHWARLAPEAIHLLHGAMAVGTHTQKPSACNTCEIVTKIEHTADTVSRESA